MKIVAFRNNKTIRIDFFLFMTSDNTCIMGFFQLKNENPILSKIESQLINLCQHPTHQVNVSRKGVLCALDSRTSFETPCITLLSCIYTSQQQFYWEFCLRQLW